MTPTASSTSSDTPATASFAEDDGIRLEYVH
jgi:hypothetical protein